MNLFDAPIVVTGLSVWRNIFTQKKTVSVPGRPYHALSFRRSGRITVESGGQRLVSGPGYLTYVPRGLSYDTEVLEDGSMDVVHFTTLADETDAEGLAMLQPFLLLPSCPAEQEAQFAFLSGRFRLGKERDAECLSLFYRILADARAEYLRQTGNAFCTPRMRDAKHRIDTDYGDPALKVSELAADAGISEVSFRREFRTAFGLPPLAYIKKVRMENAKSLLMTGYYSVTKAATLCGFDNVGYFSYEFHRSTGMTPREFIRQRRADE